MQTIRELFDLEHTLAADYLRGFEQPWAALSGIADMIRGVGSTLGQDYVQLQPGVWVHRTAG